MEELKEWRGAINDMTGDGVVGAKRYPLRGSQTSRDKAAGDQLTNERSVFGYVRVGPLTSACRVPINGQGRQILH